MAAVTPLLTTRGASRTFGGLTAVDRVDFSVNPGEIRAIIGPNGAGKTTLVGLISGRIALSAGTVHFDGADITRMPAYRRVRAGIAYTFQITSVFPELSVFDNVALSVQRRISDGRAGRRPRTPEEETLAALAKVGVRDFAEASAGSLSYGHQRLLEVAMGLALHPRLIILDEPTQGLSDPEITNFINLVREIARDATVLLIEHNMNVVMELAHGITVMEQGRILAEGAPAAIRADPAVQRAYLGA